MARYTGPVCKLCRRENTKLFLKGDKCYSAKCPMNNPRVQAPGQHGARRKKLTEYGVQLREKQKAKRYYGVLEKQFATYFEMANKKSGITGDNLIQILESRLDNNVTVNGQPVNIPSYLVKPGDVIAASDNFKDSQKCKAIAEAVDARPLPAWLELDKEKLSGKVVRLPEASEIDIALEVHLIVELYSK